VYLPSSLFFSSPLLSSFFFFFCSAFRRDGQMPKKQRIDFSLPPFFPPFFFPPSPSSLHRDAIRDDATQYRRFFLPFSLFPFSRRGQSKTIVAEQRERTSLLAIFFPFSPFFPREDRPMNPAPHDNRDAESSSHPPLSFFFFFFLSPARIKIKNGNTPHRLPLPPFPLLPSFFLLVRRRSDVHRPADARGEKGQRNTQPLLLFLFSFFFSFFFFFSPLPFSRSPLLGNS